MTTEAMERELIKGAAAMSDTEFSVKRARLIRAGGWWPMSLADWQTTEGRALHAKIGAARFEKEGDTAS